MTRSHTTIVAHDVHDLLNTLPTLFGFRPTESLVAVATHGPRRRFGFRLRVDIPDPGDVAQLAALVVAHLRHHGAEGVIAVALTDDQETARELLDAIQLELDELELVARVRADGERYWTDEAGAPPGGVPYEMSDHHLAIVQAVAAGQQILPDRDALVERFAAVAGERRRWLDQATATILDEIVPQVARAEPDRLAEAGIAVVGPILDRAADGGRISDADLLRVSVWVSSLAVRDEVWARLTHENAAGMTRALTLVCGSVVPPFEPAVLCLTAFAAWLTGDGAQALIAVERALRADPDYTMARLVLQILETGLSPDLWTGFDIRDDSLSDPR